MKVYISRQLSWAYIEALEQELEYKEKFISDLLVARDTINGTINDYTDKGGSN